MKDLAPSIRGLFPAWLLAAILLLSATAASQAQKAANWTGEWQISTRTGQMLMNLIQSGENVTGTVEPGAARIEGLVEGRLLRGRWSNQNEGGLIVLSMSEDGDTLTGRFDSTEYINGQRVTETSLRTARFTSAFSPRETLRTVVTAMNQAILGANPAATRFFTPLLIYPDEGLQLGGVSSRNRHWTSFWRLVNMSTFRIFHAPSNVESDEATFAISPSGGDFTYEIHFRLDEDDRWKIVLEELADIEAAVQQMLESLGHASYEEFEAARERSPRQTMRAFIDGARNWRTGGREEALAQFDLSFLPPHLRSVVGPILADYVKQIIDRAGFVIWQEIPNNPARIAPYVHFDHPLGSIVIERVAGGEGEPDRWMFSADSLKTAPVLFNAMQDMPRLEEVGESEPLTDFFRTRETIRGFSPRLLHRDLILENWQWIALLLAVLLALLSAWITGRLVAWAIGRMAAVKETRGVEWPMRIFVAGAVLLFVSNKLGIGQSGLTEIGQIIAILTVVGLTLLLFRIIGLIGGFFRRRAESTTSYIDEIVISLVTGMIKLGIVIIGVFACADIVDLPYEGVITGLGVGGVAIAFASRDTISNMLGGMLLMADRPFKRGDLIETDGQWAMVEEVGLRSTRMKTFDDSQLIIPNAHLSDRPIVNWGKRRRRKVAFDISLTYDTPREKLDLFVERLKQIYKDAPRADVHEYYIGLKTFASSSIDVEFWGYFNVYGYEAHVRCRHAFIGDVIELAKEVGVEFAFPTRTVHMMMNDAPSVGADPAMRTAKDGK